MQYEGTQHGDLLLQNQWYGTIFSHFPDAVLIIQPHTWTVLDANDQAANLLGIHINELIGAVFPYIKKSYKLLQRANSNFLLDEIMVEQPRNQRVLMLEIAIRAVEIHEQQILIVTARDISEQRTLTEKMIQTDKLALLGKLASGIAHEIRNPLAAMLLQLQSLLRRYSPNSQEFKQLQIIIEGVNRINSIIHNTLSFSRLTPANFTLQPIEPILQKALELIQPLLRRNKKITLHLDIEPNLPPLYIDGTLMEQVLLNLLTNAIEAIPLEGQISIVVCQTPSEDLSSSLYHKDFVEIRISDTGLGIAPDDLPRIFMPFFTKKPGGIGLGLAITQRIIMEHNGNINVQSIPNKGTTFYVKLPIPKNEQAATKS